MKEGTKRSTGRLVGFMALLVAAGVLIARSYYVNLNRSVDPRIKPARELYEQYDRIAPSGDYYRISALLDSISMHYSGIYHYAGSFEIGVLHNNRAAALLTIALHGDRIPESANPYHTWKSDSIVSLAEYHIRMAISIYEQWDQRFKGKKDVDIARMIRTEFMQGLEHVDPELGEKYLRNRVREILSSLVENQRRLSVCYTNLGLVYRLRGEHVEAVSQYERAMALWDRNLEAENNLNRLLGRPLKKRNIIQKLFPPDKEIPNNK